jgi:hypothetical protein
MERLFKRPVLRSQKAGHGPVFRHGTEKFGPLPVSEQVIGALACGGLAETSSGLDIFGDPPGSWRSCQLLVQRDCCKPYKIQMRFCIITRYPRGNNAFR